MGGSVQSQKPTEINRKERSVSVIANQKPFAERIFKKAALLTMVSVASMMPFNKANAAGDIRYIVPKGKSVTYVETTVAYKLPLGVKGSTFIDLYSGDGGYFGKTAFEKRVIGNAGLKSTTVHSNNLFTQVGLGANVIIPTPKWMFAKVGVLPVWRDGKSIVEHKSIVEYFVQFSLPLGFDLSSFGEWNFVALGGPKWTYGEVAFGRKIGPFSVSYNPVLVADGDATPATVQRLSMGIEFQ